MRAIRIHEFGGPDVMQLEDVPTPEPGEGQIRIDVAAAGVNFIDVYQRTGLYPMQLPYIPGMEAAGTVDAVGPGVSGVAVGDRVAHGFVPGGYAEQQVVPADRAVAVPDEVTFETAAAVMLQGLTAHYLTTSTFPLEVGHTALVHAGAGGVGLLLIQLAARSGATVYATTSTEEKAALARAAGATEVIRYDQVPVDQEVERLTGGRGVDVVYDSVGKDTFEASLASLTRRGMLVLFGQSSGPAPMFDPQRLNAAGGLFLTRPSLAHYTATAEELAWRASDLFGWIRNGDLEVRIGETHPLEDAAEAHRRLEGRATTGKVLLQV